MPSRIQSNPKVAVPQKVDAKSAQQVATSVRVDDNGSVYAKVGGKELQVGKDAVSAWVVGGKVAYSGRDGAGGYEGEGMSLRMFDPATGETKKVLSEYVMINDVRAVKTPDGKTALLVAMQDGGLGGDHAAIVDPTRGQVFRQPLARLDVSGNQLTVKHYSTGQYDDLSQDVSKLKPAKTETLNLSEVLSRPTLTNRPTHEFEEEPAAPAVELSPKANVGASHVPTRASVFGSEE